MSVAIRRARLLSIALALALVISIVGVASPAMATLYLRPGIPSGNGVVPTVVSDFPGCDEGLTAYTWVGGNPGTQVTPEGLSITVSPTNQHLPGRDDRYFDFSVDGGEISQVVVLTEVFFIGWITESNVYDYPEAVTGDTRLHPPTDWRDRPFKIDGARFCYEPTVDISGVVYHDLSADGAKNGDDSGLSGEEWTVAATNGDNSYSATPGEGGYYSFDDLPPGLYEVCQDSPEGWIQSEPASDGCYDVSSNTSDADFGKYQNASISGTVLVDANGDGELSIGETTPVPGATVTVNGFSDTSDTTGDYVIVDVKPGTYDICQTPPSGWTQSFPAGCYEEVQVQSGDSLAGKDFGDYEEASISGFRLINDEGFPGQTMRLLGGAEPMTTTSGSDGSYVFDGLAPGDYTVCTASIDGETSGGSSTACDEGEVGTDVSVASGEAVEDVDFTDEIAGAEVAECGLAEALGDEGVSGSVLFADCEGSKVIRFLADPDPDPEVNEVSFENVGEWTGAGYSLEQWTFDSVPTSTAGDWRLFYDDGGGEFVAPFCLVDPRDGGFSVPAGLDTDLILPLNGQTMGDTGDRHTTCIIEDHRTVTDSGVKGDFVLFSIGDPVRGFR